MRTNSLHSHGDIIVERLKIIVMLALFILAGCASQSAPPTPTALPPTETPTEIPQAEVEVINVLRVDSNHAEFAWSQEIHRGVVDALSENGYSVEAGNLNIEVRYMDTKRQTSPEYFEQISDELTAYITETQPDIVIANDDNAARLVAQPLRTGDIPFVLTGINGTPEQYEFDATTNVCGILERPHAAQMATWIEQVFGEGTRLTILAEDSSTSDRMFGDGTLAEQLGDSSLAMGDIVRTSDFEEWQAYVENVGESSDVLFLGAYAALQRDNGEAVQTLDALNWTLENSPIPVMGFWEEAVHIGTLGGPIISGYTQGHEAGLKAVEILGGGRCADIGFSVPPRGKLMINRNAMENWNVEIPLDLLEVSEIVTE
jgi:ABC-type uncharacterized transport system substrate-binding protein